MFSALVESSPDSSQDTEESLAALALALADKNRSVLQQDAVPTPMPQRLIVELDESQASELDELMSVSGVKSKLDLVRHAFGLLQWASREIAAGKTITSLDPVAGTHEQVEFEFFDQIPRHQATSGD